MSSNIRITRKCQYCGKQFIAKTTVTKNCSDYCAKRAYKQRLKEHKITTTELETGATFQVIENNLHEKAYLSIKEAATLFGISTRTISRMIASKKLPIIRFNNRIILQKEELLRKLKIF
ncbi:helix-turn-helix domain-containing protein [Pontibacter sp. FD36]|uniref:helix-turn-helix domain-containing protein n=1 Tax=Pontibacter sp. FD36 TaxID=2789860 RepID=UPI0018AA1707|nr:helix-turn-helix domain-containing protein [Pontibacter sp. FD36]MBF8962166.1 helix-turn-helix domain-containing protein [Pontibacter sp. FD36]